MIVFIKDGVPFVFIDQLGTWRRAILVDPQECICRHGKNLIPTSICMNCIFNTKEEEK